VVERVAQRTSTSRVVFVRLTRVILAALVLAALAAPAYAHVTLVSSSPGADHLIDVAPTHVRVTFSGRVEARFSTLTVLAPDGGQVPTGGVVFAEGSDREFMVAIPPVNVPGRYTVRWRTAGADGHVLEGSFLFVLAGDTTAMAAAAADTLPLLDLAGDPHVHGHEHDHVHGGAGVLLPVLGRWLHFLALALLIGAVAFRVLLLPQAGAAGGRSAGDAAARGTADAPVHAWRDVQRRAWRTLSIAALLLAASAVLRLWVQSAALHGAEAAWSSALLSIMLTDTVWGRAWLVQAFFFALLGAGIVQARPGRDRVAVWIVSVAAIGLAAVPALSGHAAGAAGFAPLAVVNDTIHVLGMGAWLGTLAIILFAAIPGLLRHGASPDAAIADVIERFSPVALGAAAVVAATGVINSLMHVGTVSHLIDTAYGRTLLAKLAGVAAVLATGFYHWRMVRPRLGASDRTRRLRLSISAELLLAAVVLLITAILTGQQRP
jgi:putative copper export protein/methionine-rich copper-binding protein CopC